MVVTGVICEYNPFHSGHSKQLAWIRQQFPQGAIVCLMSGNFVQRGHPAILDKSLRARAAVDCGADLVLEMPVEVCLSSAEGFAAGAVRLLSPICTQLCFGGESATRESLLATAQALLSPDFPPALRGFLDSGLSFPAARARALEAMGLDASLLSSPNDTLAVEYCKAILAQNSPLDIVPIRREGGYHDTTADARNPSATFLRQLMAQGQDIRPYVPQAALCQSSGQTHSLAAGERAVLSKLRTMTDAQFEALPYGSEGLWRKLMHASLREATLEAVLAAVKSKRYTRSRLDRMVMCAFLGLTAQDLAAPAPYLRVLAMNSQGRRMLKAAREHTAILNPGDIPFDPYWNTEARLGRLYGLFAQGAPESPDAEQNRRIYYKEGFL